MKSLPLVLLVAAALPASVGAQASVFGTRALGLPVLPLSARAQGMGGGGALFDPQVSLNPAALSVAGRPAASVTLRQFWRTSENAFGRGEGNDTQFPLIMVTGPISSKWNFGLSVSAYTDRTFALTLEDTLDLRETPVAIFDTLISRGGVTDIRGALAWSPNSRVSVGVGLHVLTGTNRFEYRRFFDDSTYSPVRIRNELSFSGPGVSAGITVTPVAGLTLAGLARLDGDLHYYKDSTRLENIPLPVTLGAGLQWQAGPRLLLAANGLRRNWSVADERIRSEGGAGARNTTEGAVGLEWARNGRVPYRFPLRLGVRYAQLPFPVVTGQRGKEVMASLGTGFRFTGQRGSLDIALERAWRSDGGGFTERTFMLSIGLGVRP